MLTVFPRNGLPPFYPEQRVKFIDQKAEGGGSGKSGPKIGKEKRGFGCGVQRLNCTIKGKWVLSYNWDT